uniref:HEAT repeat domain-containing protein n=1 Tax=Fervidobacterium pennivorans TaxID=93466 RepID=A0A7V4KDZ5_FERPE
MSGDEKLFDDFDKDNGGYDQERNEAQEREREELIRRIVEEKGEDAYDEMISLLEKEDDDPEVREIVTEVLYRLGDRIASKLEKTIKEKIKSGIKNDVPLLYLIDLAGDLGLRRLVTDITKALELYDLEEAQLVIYEALAKLGAGEQFYPLLRYMLLEGEERFMFGAQVAMVLSYLDIPEIVSDLVQAIDSGDFKGEELETIKQALSNMISLHPSYKEILITLVGEDNFEKYVR